MSEPSEHATPRDVAYDIGWEHGLHGLPMVRHRPAPSVDEQRAYIDGYRLGEAERVGIHTRRMPAEMHADLNRVRVVIYVGLVTALLVIGVMLGISAR